MTPQRPVWRGFWGLALIPNAARADVCPTIYPDWDGEAFTMWDEATALLLAPFGLFLIGALAVAILFRHAVGVAIASVMWAFYVSTIVTHDGDGLGADMIAEGCKAPATLFVVLVTAICLAAVIYTMRFEKRL